MCWLEYIDPVTKETVKTALMHPAKADRLMSELRSQYANLHIEKKRAQRR